VIRSQIFQSYPRQPCMALLHLVNSRWRTETGSSYKLVTGRDKAYQRDVSGYDTVLGHAQSTFTSADIVRLRRGTNRK